MAAISRITGEVVAPAKVAEIVAERKKETDEARRMADENMPTVEEIVSGVSKRAERVMPQVRTIPPRDVIRDTADKEAKQAEASVLAEKGAKGVLAKSLGEKPTVDTKAAISQANALNRLRRWFGIRR